MDAWMANDGEKKTLDRSLKMQQLGEKCNYEEIQVAFEALIK